MTGSGMNRAWNAGAASEWPQVRSAISKSANCAPAIASSSSALRTPRNTRITQAPRTSRHGPRTTRSTPPSPDRYRVQRGRDRLDGLARHAGVQRDGEHVIADPIGDRAGGRPLRGQRRLARDGDGIVHQSLDPAGLQLRRQRGAIAAEDREEMINMARITLGGDSPRRVGEPAPVLRRECPPLGRPAWQPGQPRAKDRGLQLVEAGVPPALAAVIASRLTPPSRPPPPPRP